MGLLVIGTGLPRTGTESLKRALERLLDGPCYHMSAISGHPFDLGPWWKLALEGQADRVDWTRVFDGYVAAVDWPTAAFSREISAAHPDALVVHSERKDAQVWWESMDATVLKVARMSSAPGWTEGHDLERLLERLTGTPAWDDAELLRQAYADHGTAMRETSHPGRVLMWRPEDGWEPICRMLDLPVPDEAFPHTNRRADW